MAKPPVDRGGGLTIPFISKSDLMENKRQVGRLRDLADIEELSLVSEFERRPADEAGKTGPSD